MASTSAAVAQTPGELTQDNVKTMKEFVMFYNQLAEHCFRNCIRDFTSREVSDRENACANNCLEKYMKANQRISLRFQEYHVQQNEAAFAAVQAKPPSGAGGILKN